MKKKEFLDELYQLLNQNNCKDKEDIIKDFEEHFKNRRTRWKIRRRNC